jgi:hypothetical protein
MADWGRRAGHDAGIEFCTTVWFSHPATKIRKTRPPPRQVSVVQWVVTGRWPDPGVHVDVAFVPHGISPLI